MDLSGKRVLICQPIVYGINGSTMVTLELAEEIRRRAGEITVYANIVDSPAREIFYEKKINLNSYDDNPKYKLQDFDLIWIHSQTLPKSIVSDLSNIGRLKKAPIFIFLHMSPFNNFSDERPWIYELEERLADKVLVISEEVAEVISGYIPKAKLEYFRNPAPYIYRRNNESSDNGGKIPKKILIVSNHCPNEILEAKKSLSDKGLQVDILGESGRYTPATPELLKQYDVIITIGKTVQYCLLLGIPVYIYDHFGGDGYLNAKNFKLNKRTNFSGRSHNKKKSGETIADEIINNYSSAKRYILEHKIDFDNTFSLDRTLDHILEDLELHKKYDFSSEYIKYVETSQDLARHSMYYGGYDSYRKKQLIRKIEEENDKLKSELYGIKNTRAYRITVLIKRIVNKAKGIIMLGD